MIKKFLYGLVILALVLAIAFPFRFLLLVKIGSWIGQPELTEAKIEPGASWFDDYFTVFKIDDRTYAIGETRYWQQNFNYLILGDQRAILFDAGPGLRDIRDVVKSLTDLPVTFIPSHFHFDHMGNGIEFERTALIDLPYLRKRATGNLLTLDFYEHMGEMEGYPLPTIKVSEWLAPNTSIDLGGRAIDVIYTPGHTPDGVTLLDKTAGYAFTGDFFILGGLAEFLPNGRMGDYLFGVSNLVAAAPADTRLFAAHRDIMWHQNPTGIPEATMDDLRDTLALLSAVKAEEESGSGVYPVIYVINPRVQLWANPPFMQDWETTVEP